MIPFVDLKAQYRTLKPEIDEAMQRVVDRAAFIMGDEVRIFEEEFADFCEARWCVGVSSGTAALHLALLACDVGPGDEIITTPFTFIATAEAISQCGAIPVFVDIDPSTYTLDAELIEHAVTERTKAILPVHLYGQPAPMREIMAIAQRHGLRVIEDAAQAHGARYEGAAVGTLGDVGCFSFFPGKNLGAYGDAGAVVTNDDSIRRRVAMLRDHGRTSKYEHEVEGFADRLDALQAAILRVKLRHLASWNRRRQALAAVYDQVLVEVPCKTPDQRPDIEHVFHLYVIRVVGRDAVLATMKAEEIHAGVHYPIPLHLQPAYRRLGHELGAFPRAEEAARGVLSLPLYPELGEEQVTQVAETLKHALAAAYSH